LTTSEAKQDLVATIEIQGKRYDFIVDSGADICLVQPYVGERQIKQQHMVRGVTGDSLEATESRDRVLARKPILLP
jgi:hypothetical protein